MRTCINLTGKLQFERISLWRIANQNKANLPQAIDKYAKRLSNEYCLEICRKRQLCNFYARYGMPEQPKKEFAFESVYVHENGLEELHG